MTVKWPWAIFTSMAVFGVGLSQSIAEDRTETAVRILVTLCVSGGSVTVSESRSDPSGGEFRLESDKGNFRIESREARGIVDGLGAALNALSADQANRARDCMRPYISQVLAIATGSQTEVPPQKHDKLMNARVIYYLKTADGSRITDALKRHGIAFTQLSSSLPDTLHTNAIRCAQQTPVGAIKGLALTLVDSGIPLQAIQRTARQEVTNTLALFARVSRRQKELTSPPLSRAQIEAITECPKDTNTFIANFKRFENPHPTGRPGDTRFVDKWFDREHKRGPDEAAALFCAQRGFADSAAWQTGRIMRNNSVVVRIGDNSICTGDCPVFTSIDCE